MFRLLTLLICTCTIVSAADNAAPWENQEWSDTRTLVWANPGTSGAINKPEMWRTPSGGKVNKGPDRDTDIILPASKKRYIVKGPRKAVRHVRIEDNAMLIGGHRSELEIWGNCDVLDGGMIHFISIVGPSDTYFKIENSIMPGLPGANGHPAGKKLYSGWDRSRGAISHKFQVCKYGSASVEFIGQFGVTDEIMLQHGRMIVNGRFHWSGSTGKGALEIYDGGILELQSGALVGPFIGSNHKNVYNMNVYRGGKIQAGSPERPLTDDCYLLMGLESGKKAGKSGLYSAVGSSIRVYSSDPSKHKLVLSSITSREDYFDGEGKPVGSPSKKASGNTGVHLYLGGDVVLDGVELDYIAQGGVKLTDPATIKEWKNVSFGNNCAGSQKDLISKLNVDANVYYHNRGDAKSEYGLTTTAVSSMQKYLEQNDPMRLTFSPEATATDKRKGYTTLPAKVFKGKVDVDITCASNRATIHYTTDGTTPTTDSEKWEGTLTLTESTQIRAIAVSGKQTSLTYTQAYVVE